MTGNFNIRDSNWDLDDPYYSVHSNLLFNIADSSVVLQQCTFIISSQQAQ